MTTVAEARAFAIAAHQAVNQVRKHSGIAYWHHPEDVVNVLEEFGVGKSLPEIAMAAWLHDTVEDTAVDLETIELCFGSWVRRLVDALTKVEGDAEASNRKVFDVGGYSAVVIKFADTIANLRDCREEADANPKWAEKFCSKKARMMQVIQQDLHRLVSPLSSQAIFMISEITALIAQIRGIVRTSK